MLYNSAHSTPNHHNHHHQQHIVIKFVFFVADNGAEMCLNFNSIGNINLTFFTGNKVSSPAGKSLYRDVLPSSPRLTRLKCVADSSGISPAMCKLLMAPASGVKQKLSSLER
uniref:Uncharacterized protein n=1 Tax=Glossina pallidipes TaxID=7398 RepID=A0A1B0AB55_GLOPL